jgi:hypothetical protein
VSEPKPSTLKARRRKSPVFIDEPIQWHLRHGRYDRCPWCGLQELERRGTKKRICTNGACEATFEISLSQRDWQDNKLFGFEDELDMSGSDDLSNSDPTPGEELYTLKDAQLRSDNGRAFTTFSRFDGLGDRKVYWHRTGKLPERADGRPACAGGSTYWREICALQKEKAWAPDKPLNAMEVIAKAYGTDEPMFAIMRS